MWAFSKQTNQLHFFGPPCVSTAKVRNMTFILSVLCQCVKHLPLIVVCKAEIPRGLLFYTDAFNWFVQLSVFFLFLMNILLIYRVLYSLAICPDSFAIFMTLVIVFLYVYCLLLRASTVLL